jgi:hypothetical protein
MERLTLTSNATEEIELIDDDTRLTFRLIDRISGNKAVIILNPDEARKASDFIRDRLKKRLPRYLNIIGQ